jgi:hypothetical protein
VINAIVTHELQYRKTVEQVLINGYWEAVLVEEGQWRNHKIDGKMSYRGMHQPAPGSELEVCSKR